MSFARALRCLDCEATFPSTLFRYRCERCEGFLGVRYDYEEIKSAISLTDITSCGTATPIERWRPFLPIERPELVDVVTLGERETPLLSCGRLGERLGLDELWIKNESAFPTGSLKDRSMPLMTLKALEYGRSTVAIVSSGNAAASLAAYAAGAGLKAVVFVRAEASPSKLAKIAIYDPIFVRVRSHLADIGRLFDELVDELGWFDCDGMVNPFRCEGKKTCAFEIALQLGWRAPDVVLIPTSSGNGMVAAHLGFKELLTLGLIEKMPRLVGVQFEACSPIAQAFEAGADKVEAIVPSPSVSDTLLNGSPDAGAMVLRAARETAGTVVTVSDDEMLRAQSDLARRAGIFAEPAGAVALGAARRLAKTGMIRSPDTVVCLVTGHGLNQPDVVEANVEPPEALDPDLGSIRGFLSRTLDTR